MNKEKYTIQESMAAFEPPILIVSSFVGRGNYSIGEAFKQQCGDGVACYHEAVEDLLPSSAVQEDLQRYKWIANNLRFLFYLIYTIPLFYYRKYAREKWLCKTNLSVLEKKVRTLGIKTVICVSHRPAFWLSLLKVRTKLDFSLWGVLAEFGTNLGWRYIFWDSMNGYLSVIPQKQLKIDFPIGLSFKDLELPCRKEFFEMAHTKADKDNLLFVAGYWGQMEIRKAIDLIKRLLIEFPGLKVHVVCGTNEILEKEIRNYFSSNGYVKIYNNVDSLLDIMSNCASVVTKPGFSTLVEAHSAARKIFLLKGMPIAEDHNAAYAIDNFSAEWYSIENFKRWYTVS